MNIKLLVRTKLFYYLLENTCIGKRNEQCVTFVAHYIFSTISGHLICTSKKESWKIQVAEAVEQVNMMKGKKQVLKKTRTFLLEKSPTMEYKITAPADQYSTDTFVTRKSLPVMEFPTSPQLIFGEEIIHFSHPQHPLSLVNLPDLFTCDGCKEYGSGKRFVCQQCDYQLHDFCGLAPPALKAHPLHSQHSILFHSKPGMTMTGLSPHSSYTK